MILSKLSKQHHDIYIICIKNLSNTELENLYELLKAQFKMYSEGMWPLKATGTQWIDHELGAMESMIEVFSLNSQHLQNVIAATSNWQGRLT